MKRKGLIVILGMMFFALSACQSQSTTATEACWSAAQEADDLEAYVKAEAANIDVAALQEEASAADSTLLQQFQATVLLCEIDCQGGANASSYAESFLAKAIINEDQIWEVFDTTFNVDGCISALFEAAEQIDGRALAKLWGNMPDSVVYESELRLAIEHWVEAHPDKLPTYENDLKAVGYFDEWDADDWTSNYLYNSDDPYCLTIKMADDALVYINFLRGTMLPEWETEYGEQSFRTPSELGEDAYYVTNLAPTVTEKLHFKSDAGEEPLPETIDLEGKKVVAFYRNPYAREYEGSPTELRIIGDFMLGLPDEAYPTSLKNADYYLVLTPSYESGDSKKIDMKNASERQEAYSGTSVDLYNAETRSFLRHLGTIKESSLASAVNDISEYSKLPQADQLYFMYQNINTPDAYASMITDYSYFQAEEPVSIGGWEITYHDCEIVESFEEGSFIYTASEVGCQIVRARFTITNVGSKQNTFLPIVYTIAEDPLVRLTDSSHENYYEVSDGLTLKSNLMSETLNPGVSMDGELFFQLPDEVAQGTEPVYIVISLGDEEMFCPLLEAEEAEE